MITFRKLSADSDGRLLRAYYREDDPGPTSDPRTTPGKHADSGERMTAYYTGRDSHGAWRPDMAPEVAAALGIDPTKAPTNIELDRLFEGKRADNGEVWSTTSKPRSISAIDFVSAPHKSVSLAAEFAKTPAEQAAIQHAVDRANDSVMRYIADELGIARRGKGGELGADAGEVGWMTVRHFAARPTFQVQDGQNGVTYLADVPIAGDPHTHRHNIVYNLVATPEGRIGSLDMKRLTSTRVLEFGAFFQARLADELRAIGIQTGYDQKGEAVVATAIPQAAVDAFSKGRNQTVRNAKAFAKKQGLQWDELSADRKYGLLSAAAVVERRDKEDSRTARQVWRDQAKAMGWHHETVLKGAHYEALPDAERHDRAYTSAADRLAEDFHTSAVVDHGRLRLHATRALIGTGIGGGVEDIDRVVGLIEERGIMLKGEHVALISGVRDDRVWVTNTAQIRIEQKLGDLAKAAAQDKDAALSTEALRHAIDTSGLDFAREPEHGAAQKAAIYALGTSGRLSFVTGVAGSGKSTLLKPLVAAYQADTTYSPNGRELVGVATAWRQADAVRDANIRRTYALQPLLDAIDSGDFRPTANTVLVLEEVSQIGPRSMLRLLELQAETGMTIKALGDREQCQSIEAGDTIELLRRVLPEDAMPEILTTVRQKSGRARLIASLFRGNDNDRDLSAAQKQVKRLADVKAAVGMKREDGTIQLVGGDQDQVIGQIADLYIARRDVLRASGSKNGITVSALTNQDAAEISAVIRDRLKARGELGDDERIHPALARRGDQTEAFDLPLATGDKVRLYRKTAARIDGKPGFIGSNGDVVEILAKTEQGLTLRNRHGDVGEVEWRRLKDAGSDRLLLGFGHVLTIDSAQGITSDEHINALPRGTAGLTAFKNYVAESRHTGKAWTMISEIAVFEAVKNKLALGDQRPIATDDLYNQVAEDMARKDYKQLAVDLLASVNKDHEHAIEGFTRSGQVLETAEQAGRKLGLEAKARTRKQMVRRALAKHIVALDVAITRNGDMLQAFGQEITQHLHELCDGLNHVHDIVKQRQAEMRSAEERRTGREPGMGV